MTQSLWLAMQRLQWTLSVGKAVSPRSLAEFEPPPQSQLTVASERRPWKAMRIRNAGVSTKSWPRSRLIIAWNDAGPIHPFGGVGKKPARQAAASAGVNCP